MRIHAKIEKQLKITDLYTAFSAVRTPDYNFCGESHDFWELLIVNEGDIGSVINNEVKYFSAGQCVIYEPMEFHSVWVEGDVCAKITVFTFSAENMPELKHRTFEIDEGAQKLAEEILCEINLSFNVQGISVLDVNSGCEISAEIAVKRLEILLLDTLRKQIDTDTPVMPKRALALERIINILEERIYENLTVEEIAKMASISPSYLQKVFMKYVGMGVMSYFNRMKITYAVLMLQNGMSVAETSERLGFLSPNYFSTVFKRFNGVSPSVYKKEL